MSKSLIILNNEKCFEVPADESSERINIETYSMPENRKTFIFEQNEIVYSLMNIDVLWVGSENGAHIMPDDNSVSFAVKHDRIIVFSDGVYMNGRPIQLGEYPYNYGDCIIAGTFKITINENLATITGSGYSTILKRAILPAAYEEFPIYKRSPRIIKRVPEDTVELLEPPKKEKRKKSEIIKMILPPLLMLCVMIAVSVLMKRGLFILVSAAGMAMSLVFSVTTFISDKKEKKQTEKERTESYEKYLLEQRKKINDLYLKQKESLLFHNPSVFDIENMISNYSSRLYERSINDSDFLSVCLGFADAASSYKVKYKSNTLELEKDELHDEMTDMATGFLTIPDMPISIDLKKANLGFVGDKECIRSQLKVLISQLCFFQSYQETELIMLTDEAGAEEFDWIRWAPHCKVKNINITGLISGENQRDQVLGNIAQIFKMRKQKKDEEKKNGMFLPYYIFIIDNPKLIVNHSIMEYLQANADGMGFCIVYTTNIQANLPDNIKTIAVLENKNSGILVMNEGVLLNKRFKLQNSEKIDFERMSRSLAPIIHNTGVSTQIPDSIDFLEMYNVKKPSEIPISMLWRQNASYKSLAVPLGVRAKNDYVYLDLHEKAHGPHGLVAGTTGSGKSEILQSYILSLAVNFHPYEVGFLLIDYKGGGMANLFNKLPHLLGTITNLDGSESMRALASIKSELARRQRVFNDNGVNNINQYTKLFRSGKTKLALPHLFIISDEFAELKKEQPDFMSELVSAARIGRSLGVHLILATQKPTGVVDDQIWSNSKFKLALKVQDESDSKEVLKTPDAARITQPGRSYLQVGNNEIYELFQSAWSGASYSEGTVERGFDDRIYLINPLGQGKLINQDLSSSQEDEGKLTQLEAVVDEILKVYNSTASTPVDKPWLPPLSKEIISPYVYMSSEDVSKNTQSDLSIPLGIVDIPENQKQIEFVHNFEKDGNLAFFGAPGFGKSTSLTTIALDLALKNSPELLNYYILDLGNAALIQLKGLPHTADYLSFDEDEKREKLVKFLLEEMRARKTMFARKNAINFRMYNSLSENKLPAIIVFIDNYDVVKELGLDFEDFIGKITRDGTGIGIYTVITASRVNSVRYAVLNNIKNKIAQYMFEASEITPIVGRTNYKLPEIKGRSLVKLKEASLMQCFAPAPVIDENEYVENINKIINSIQINNTAPKASPIKMLPEVLIYEDMLSNANGLSNNIAVGVDSENVDVQYISTDVSIHIVVGAPQSGKTNLLKLIIKQSQAKQIFVSDSRGYDLQRLSSETNTVYVCNDSEIEAFYIRLSQVVTERRAAYENSKTEKTPREFFAELDSVMLVIDDADRFIEICKPVAQKMEQLLPLAIECGVCIVASTLPSRLRGYDNITKMLKESQSGIVLGNPTEQSLFSFQAPRGYKQQTDMGFLYFRGSSRNIKIPLI